MPSFIGSPEINFAGWWELISSALACCACTYEPNESMKRKAIPVRIS